MIWIFDTYMMAFYQPVGSSYSNVQNTNSLIPHQILSSGPKHSLKFQNKMNLLRGRLTHFYLSFSRTVPKSSIFIITDTTKWVQRYFSHMAVCIYINTVKNQGTGLCRQCFGKHSTSINSECHRPLSNIILIAICFD